MEYHGANTGRWAGRRVQPQNLPQQNMSQADITAAIDYIISGGTAEGVEIFFGPVMSVISNLIRSCLCAAPGHDLIVADFSAIEARVLAWLAGQHDTLDIFRADGKIYEHAAAGIYAVHKDDVTKDDPRRKVGKTAVLALGYQGGIGAFVAMIPASSPNKYLL